MSNVLKLAEIYKEIQESFDFNKIEEKPFSKINSTEYKSSDSTLKVEFQEIPKSILHKKYHNADGCYNVLFTIDDIQTQAKKTDYSEFISILKTVKLVTEDFIQNEHPQILVFLSIDKMGSGLITDPQKDRLYKYAITKNLPSGYGIDYDIKPYESLNMTGIVLFRKDLKIPTK